MNTQNLIPHFVADRQMSLRILAGLDIETHPVHFGLMLQACGTENYRNMVSRFPCMEKDYCTVVQGKCPYGGDITRCKPGLNIKKHVTTIADSGVFTKNGSSIDYVELFNRYKQMGIERGIILDVLRDSKSTIISAKNAFELFSKNNYDFRLIGVAQGKNPHEYLSCYNKLKNIGYTEIAIGGFLTKKVNTARYAHSNKEEIAAVVKKIKSEWPDDRCFVLGVYNPKRHEFLEELGVNAADYKGWIFQYKRNYENPYLHHFDRITQIQQFIEVNIFSRISGKTSRKKSLKNINLYMKSNIQINGNRVFIKNENERSNLSNHYEKIIVIACGKKKCKQIECEAKDAYIGSSFCLKRKYAELSQRPWLILSAKYGFLHPNDRINSNYNQTITTKNDIEILENVIRQQIGDIFNSGKCYEITFLGPEKYVDALNHASNGNSKIKVIHLTHGLNQGRTMQKLNELIISLEHEREIGKLNNHA